MACIRVQQAVASFESILLQVPILKGQSRKPAFDLPHSCAIAGSWNQLALAAPQTQGV